MHTLQIEVVGVVVCGVALLSFVAFQLRNFPVSDAMATQHNLWINWPLGAMAATAGLLSLAGTDPQQRLKRVLHRRSSM